MILKPEQQVERCKRVMKERIEPRIHPVLERCSVKAFRNPGEPEPADDVLARAQHGAIPFIDVAQNEPWGTSWGTTWFKVTGNAHLDEAQGRAIELVARLGYLDGPVGGQVEGLVYRPDGTVIKGLHPRNFTIPLVDAEGRRDSIVDDSGNFTLYIEGAYNPMIPAFPQTNWGNGPTECADVRYEFRGVDVCAYEHELAEYHMDLDAISMALEQLDKEGARYWHLAKALQRSLNIFDMRDLTTVRPARQALTEVLRAPANHSSIQLAAIGHAHIDSAWLWPVRETKRKVARTVSNALLLMDNDPDYIHAMSSAQQYEWLEEAHPDLFERMKHRIQEGRFVPVGAMWVESDGMIPTGESLIRQISFGKRYYREKLNCDTDIIWLPDSFGYTGAFPQIARRAGYRYFLTQKISWNDTTRLPHHSFMWEGIDGSRIFTHFPPADTYGAFVTAQELDYAQRNFKDKDLSSRGALLFGYGDGGGGVPREMAGRVRRYRDFEGLPRTEYMSPKAFFDTAYQEMRDEAGDEFPVWKGELYLELHRATLTAQQAMKRGCRLTESMLRAAEYLCAMAALYQDDYTYPVDEFTSIWKQLLLNQFHDILPGSGIAWLYRQARDEYSRDLRRLHRLCADAAIALSKALPQAKILTRGRISPFSAQKEDDLAWRTVPTTVTTPTTPVTMRPHDEGYEIDNGLLRAIISSDGAVTSLYDIAADREIIPQDTRMGQYELLKDEPSVFDAWDIERDAFITAKPVSGGRLISARIDGTGAATVRSEIHVEATTIITDITLRPGSRQMDFHTHVDWHTQEQFLKVDIPIAIETTRAIYDCQYGLTERPIQKNTVRDEAMFESCSHRFIHITDHQYATGVVNASTYGSDVSPIHGSQPGTMVRLSLLSGSCAPDPQADQGEHDFDWAVVPSYSLEATIASAYTLNAPVIENLPEMSSPVRISCAEGTAIIDWIKLADDGSGDLIVRLYEAVGATVRATLQTYGPLADAVVSETNELEEGIRYTDEPTALQEDGIHADGAPLTLRPFQLATLRITPTSR
ncbi:alpha-mannosidase [Bifidobacterium lemurum]|uniref:Alpha-mannosidase n=1 Tax=Bifidobacterium lemurum TaxID=1603886 RepID=A0A261FP60_9BIFI|nr:glycoside hydrolase family 38 C-terminal domain-containing protein [Bifidobacterium lemurum]OZG60937.1 alpha-mannosidase [Bifidobacterium lemurum]QOL34988.1 alpha-mannosidase [Bifidobacterium lemurum]